MANLTIAVDDEVLHRARVRAVEQKTSVNALLRDYLGAYAGLSQEQLDAGRRILEASRNAKSGSGGRRWTRDELHER